MEVSTEISALFRLGDYQTILKTLKESGFTAYDFSMSWEGPNSKLICADDYLDRAKALRAYADSIGIKCNQSHAPFHTSVKCVRDSLKRAIEATAAAGGEICVIHPFNNGTVEENAEFYHTLLPFAAECGVKIATENMWCWDREKDQASVAACSHHDDFLAHIKAVNDPYLVACLDLGHAEMKGLGTTAVEMIRALGATGGLAALHVHDNDRWHDSHQIPYSMKMDFGAITKALREVGYKGYCTLEADAYLAAYKDDLFTGIQNLQKAARRFCDDFEAK